MAGFIHEFSKRQSKEGLVPKDRFNALRQSLERGVAFHDTPTLVWDVSESTGIRGNVIFPGATASARCPLSPAFRRVGLDLILELEPTPVYFRAAADGAWGRVVPTFQGLPVTDAPPPQLVQVDGDFVLYLITGGGAARLEVLPAAGPPAYDANFHVYRLYSWSVISGRPDDIVNLGCDALEVDGQQDNAFHPLLSTPDGGVSWLVRFHPGYVFEIIQGAEIRHVPVTPGAVAVAVGDIWWLHVTTDNFGTITLAEFVKAAGGQTTVLHAEDTSSDSGQTGDYWREAVSFVADGAGNPVPEIYLRESVVWNPRSWKNIGTGAEVLKKFDPALHSYEARSTLGVVAVVTPGVDITATQAANSIDVSAMPKGATGTFKVQGLCDGNTFSPVGLVVENGMVKSIDTVTAAVGECNAIGVPPGYEETVLDVCVAGVVVSKTFLTKI